MYAVEGILSDFEAYFEAGEGNQKATQAKCGFLRPLEHALSRVEFTLTGPPLDKKAFTSLIAGKGQAM